MPRAIFRIEHRLGVPAPAEVIWKVISDLERWGDWCPLYPKVQGELAFGRQLAVTENLPGYEPSLITPTIVDWGPDSHIHWSVSQSFGFLRRIRYFEIDQLSEEGCIFANGEDWYGRLARYISPSRRRAMRHAFEALGDVVRDRAVALWRAEAGAPTSATA